MKGTLYIIATPIGNIEDISARAKRILLEADIVAAEDTRTSQKLLSILGIKNKTVSNHKFNEKQKAGFLVTELLKGKNIALVSEAGTPCISDPGGVIVKAAVEQGISVTGVCGASAVITALSVSGFYFDSFAFYGFLPRTASEIKKALNAAGKSKIPAAVFFESPKRIKKTLEVLAAEVPDSRLCLCNDLSKLYERIYRGTPQEILDELNENPSAEKGEYTLVVDFGKVHDPGPDTDKDSLSHEAMLIDHIIKNSNTENLTMNILLKNTVNALAEKHKNDIPKKEFYAASLNLRKMFGAP